MPRKNTILQHAEKEQIDKALIDGTSLRTIAVRYGLSKTALIRYRDKYLKDVPETIAADPRVDSATEGAKQAVIQGFNSIQSVYEDWQWAKVELMDIACRAKKTGKANTRAVEAVAKLATDRLNAFLKHAELRQEKIPLADQPEYRAVVSRLLVSLEPFPKARIAAAEALQGE